MKITSVVVNLIDKDSTRRRTNDRIIAFASVVFDGEFLVDSIRIVRGDSGKIIVCMPSRQTPSGYRDVAYPVNQRMRDHIDDTVLQVLLSKMGNGNAL